VTVQGAALVYVAADGDKLADVVEKLDLRPATRRNGARSKSRPMPTKHWPSICHTQLWRCCCSSSAVQLFASWRDLDHSFALIGWPAMKFSANTWLHVIFGLLSLPGSSSQRCCCSNGRGRTERGLGRAKPCQRPISVCVHHHDKFTCISGWFLVLFAGRCVGMAIPSSAV